MKELILLSGLLLGLTISHRMGLTVQGAIEGATTRCVEGFAGQYPCHNVDLLAHMTLAEMNGIEGANLWGWTDPENGKEYVLFGMTDGTAFVDISDPHNPVYLGSLPGRGIPSADYRDMKVYENHAFIIADTPSENGLQVFDLTELRDVISPPVTFTDTAHFDPLGNTHNLFINQETGYAYVATRSNLCSGALLMMNVNDPLNPAPAGCAAESGGLASDTMCVIYQGPDQDYQGREICVTASDDNLIVTDVTNKSVPVDVGAPLTYQHIDRAHHGWWTEDHRHFLSADMDDEHHSGLPTRTFIWDFTDVDAPFLLDVYQGPTFASDHNIWVHGGQAYIGNLHAGLRILDISDIANVNEAAYFDTYPTNDNPGHLKGAWTIYPYFESGVIAVSDQEEGLFLLRQTWPAATCPACSALIRGRAGR